MNMCQMAPNCTDFSKMSRGSMPPDPPTRACHLWCSRSCILCFKTVTQTFKLLAEALSLGWNYFRCVKVCQVHNDSTEII